MDYVSKKQLVNMREFLENYCSLTCNWKGKMTHKRMLEFLAENGKYVVRGIIGEITDEEKLTGKYLYVKDETGQIIPYKNPTMDIIRLRNSLITNTNKERLNQIRLNCLREQNLTYDEFGNVITIEEYEEKKRIEEEKLEELKQNLLMDMEEAYYEGMTSRNRHTKKYYRRGHYGKY